MKIITTTMAALALTIAALFGAFALDGTDTTDAQVAPTCPSGTELSVNDGTATCDAIPDDPVKYNVVLGERVLIVGATEIGLCVHDDAPNGAWVVRADTGERVREYVSHRNEFCGS